MPAPTLKDRVAALEAEMEQLKARLRQYQGETRQQDDRHPIDVIYGAFRGDPHFKEAMDLGRKYRESLRPKPRKKKRKSGDGHS
jgi:hypothetical protein